MKIDITKIEGYADMSAEEKIKVLESYDLPEPDYSGYVKKDIFDKTASELAAKKKELNEHLSDEEKREKEREEADQKMKEDYEKLLHETQVSKATARYIKLGWDEKLAQETAEAFVTGDTEKVFENEQKAQTAFEKKIRAEVLKSTPKPVGGSGDKVMTKADFRKMGDLDRAKWAHEHPEEYKSLYTSPDEGGND